MSLPSRIAKQLRDLHTGGNWTSVSLKEKLGGLTWQQAAAKVEPFHSIATLAFHVNYFVEAVSKVLRGGPLDSKDIYSFDCPPIHSAEDWERLVDKVMSDAEGLAKLIEELPEAKLWEPFAGEKYGSCYRNLQGIIEHTHYHLGQISMVRKMLENSAKD